MNGHNLKSCPIVGVILVWGVCLAAPALGQTGQTISVGLNSATLRFFPPHFYGANGQQRDSYPWDQIDPTTDQPYNPGFSAALQGLEYGILRIPAGTGANYWDWSTGDTVRNYNPSSLKGAEIPPSPYPSPLSEFQKELKSASQPTETHTQGDFVLNMLTDPECVPPSGQQYCSYSPSSPDESYQLQLLDTLASDGITVPYLELGNELFYSSSVFPNYPVVYPTVQDYATVADQWINDIKASSPSIEIAAVGASSGSASNCTSGGRIATWNCGLMSTLNGADAVTLHIYPAFGLSKGTLVDNNTAETMLLTPLTTWDNIVNYDLPSLVNTTTGYTPDIWFTEYNHSPSDPDEKASGTWAHGLFLAALDLLYATNPRVKMALHHDVQGGAEFGDIFATTTGFSAFGVSTPTAVDGYTAAGLMTREVDTAALGKTHAEALTFPGGPTFDGTHPKLVGEIFWRGAIGQMIMLNLDNVTHTVNLSGIVSSGKYRQIYGEAGSYVDGFVIPGGFEGWDDVTRQAANLTMAESMLTPTSLSLPAFSITRIAVNLQLPFPPRRP